MNKLKVWGLLLLGAVILSACQKPVKIACVGDSITEGVGTQVWNKSSYPVILDSLMGPDYVVMNCGRSAATMLKNSDMPYWKCNELDDVFIYQPDVIVIKLGTNDSKDHNWNAAAYEQDYQALIDTFQSIPTHPKIYMCLPAPAFEKRWNINDTTIREQVIPIIERLASVNSLPVIDVYTGLQGQAGHFPDGIHPDEAGAKKLAEVIAEGLQVQ
ncbi:GDSL-type esterase/lipase family protein [Mangrovibacterium diazotrophicum]|uniref:Lysophospholipase L1-like esterase n=1 Tax=Mangrovibacterium diazotrophicum TaxID=1261403 RepID=A0A419VYJ0_9BACT|nr:GDSL-type esterase/lipase family protein [Mangrovibacterium diazotrophicum]RKD88288.1 lysophospholipase L1-like esterase [Mangrovibacterium diazotrophicum]